MNLDEIEMKAKLTHKTDELDGLLVEAPDCLKKRVCMFITQELKTVTAKLMDCRSRKDYEGEANLMIELDFLGELNDLQVMLPEE